MKCPNCGGPLERDNRFCPYCGNQLEAEANDRKQEIHIHYHQEQSAPPQQVQYVYVPVEEKSSRSRLVALLLCVFFGWSGAHRFYMGKFVTGLLYLFTAGLYSFGWLYDVLKLLFGHPCDKKGRKLTW